MSSSSALNLNPFAASSLIVHDNDGAGFGVGRDPAAASSLNPAAASSVNPAAS